ncbi:MAG: hypothetical protein ACJ8F2_25940 [Xanthobacteraceae bacterium]
MVQTTGQRVNWQEFECNEHKLVEMAFGPDRILVLTPAGQASQAPQGPQPRRRRPERRAKPLRRRKAAGRGRRPAAS